MRKMLLIVFCMFLLCSVSARAADKYNSQIYQPTWNERLTDAKIAILKERLNAMDKAVELLGIEIQRRLKEANQVREEYTEKRSQYVLKDVHIELANRVSLIEADRALNRDRYVSIKENSTLENRVSVIETRILVYAAIIGFFFLVVKVVSGLIPTIFPKKHYEEKIKRKIKEEIVD